MKKIFIIPLLVLGFGLVSCKKESVQNETIFMQADQSAIYNPGGFVFGTCDYWSITAFQKNGIDLTKDYASLDLRFCPDNTVTIANDLFNVSGNWYFVLDKGNPYMLLIQFNATERNVLDNYMPGFWTEIGDNWSVLRMGRNLLVMQSANKSKKMSIERTGTEGAAQ